MNDVLRRARWQNDRQREPSDTACYHVSIDFHDVPPLLCEIKITSLVHLMDLHMCVATHKYSLHDHWTKTSVPLMPPPAGIRQMISSWLSPMYFPLPATEPPIEEESGANELAEEGNAHPVPHFCAKILHFVASQPEVPIVYRDQLDTRPWGLRSLSLGIGHTASAVAPDTLCSMPLPPDLENTLSADGEWASNVHSEPGCLSHWLALATKQIESALRHAHAFSRCFA